MQPSGDLVRGAHRVDREFLVLRALSERGFIVPEPIFLCDDSSIIGRQFYVMEFVDGDIFDVTLFNANELRLVQNDTYTEDGVDFVVTGELRMIR